MATKAARSEKEREKERRFKDNVAQLLRRFEKEMQEARNREAGAPPKQSSDATPPPSPEP